MILVDTTILIYAVGEDHAVAFTRPRVRGTGSRWPDLGLRRQSKPFRSLPTFEHGVARDRMPPAGREYSRGLSPLVRPDRDDLLEGLGLLEVLEGLGPFDAVLAAAARRRGWALASADRSFGQVPDLTYLDPASPTFTDHARAVG